MIMVALEYVMSQSSSVDNDGAPAHLWPDLFASLPWLPQDPASEKGFIGKIVSQEEWFVEIIKRCYVLCVVRL